MAKSFYSQRKAGWYLPIPLAVVMLALFFLILGNFRGFRSFADSGTYLSLIAGFACFALSVGLFYYLWPRAGLIPLLVFHFVLGISLMLVGKLSQGAAPYWLLVSVLLPATLLHFGVSLPHTLIDLKFSKYLLAGYALSGVLLAWGLYLHQFDAGSAYLVIIGTAYASLFAYLIWIGYLLRCWFSDQPQLEKIIPRYLLISQALVFALPVVFAMLLRQFVSPFPLIECAPLATLFPLAIWLGMIPAQRRQLQTYIVQSEKRVALGDLLAGLSHELNNPLNYVHSSLEPLQEHLATLKSGIANPDEKTMKIFQQLDRMVKNMEEGMSRAQVLLDNFKNMPSGRRPTKERIDLPSLVEGCIERLSNKWRGKVEMDPFYEDVPAILGVSGELEQAFTNLLGNAIDASPTDSTVVVRVSAASAGVKVSIRDAGAGIDREVVGKIFDPFFTTKPQGKGQGLGLAITLQIIKQHRGSIEVKSDPGRGAEFIVFIPN